MFAKKSSKYLKKDSLIQPTYGSRIMRGEIPKYQIASEGLPPSVAYNIIHDELALDGNSRLNLATFVTTWMEPEARQLMMDTFDKNMIDKDEYPQTAEIEMRCVNILSRLWNSPEGEEAVGCSTIGSSEAAMLAGMALKRNWKKRREAAGRPVDKLNFVMGRNVQVCWEKFCNYWEVEPRFVMAEGDSFSLRPEDAVKLCDENTIGVLAIMGSTFDGSYEPVKQLDDALNHLAAESGLDIPIHVDAASGGFIAPFLQPDLEWDFRVPRVKSINVSGHKYGLVYPGVGWAIWRDKKELPEELIFHCYYLGGDLPNFALNFSRPGNQVIAQYYNFLRLGREGYTAIQETCRDIALFLSANIEEMGPFELISRGDTIPVFAWKLKDEIAASTNYTLFDLAERLRYNGWLVPAYRMPENRKDIIVQRVVVKEGFSHDMAGALLGDIKKHIQWFSKHPGFTKTIDAKQFSH
ncbi:MAG: glutamate decarboxylase [Desulfocapsaceae bacterium]|nr:glutamate decarboxylase [Desulfocapsaceae bacterium]